MMRSSVVVARRSILFNSRSPHGFKRPWISTARRALSGSSVSGDKPTAVFLNSGRLDYDKCLDFSRLESLTNLVLHDVDKVRDPDEVLERLGDAPEIVITKEMELPASTFERFPSSVKLLCEAGTGYNNLPCAAARARGVAVCNTPTYSTDAVAQIVVTYVMTFAIRMLEQQRMLQNGDRSNFNGPFTLPLMELTGKTMGLLGGSGRIGSKVADICLALGMNILISSRRSSLDPSHRLAQHPRVALTTDATELWKTSDFVSIHCPLNDQTRQSIGRDQISLMKPTAFLINSARGAIVREEELIQVMREGLIAGAGLDVTATEPPSPDSGLWDLPNVFLTPHIGWRRLETRQRLIDMTSDNIEAYVKAQGREQDFINVVN